MYIRRKRPPLDTVEMGHTGESLEGASSGSLADVQGCCPESLSCRGTGG